MPAQLPNELLRRILGYLAPFERERYQYELCKMRHMTVYTEEEVKNRAALLHCSYTSHKWKQLAMPYFLRSLALWFCPRELDEYAGDLHYPHRTPSSLLSFIKSLPALQANLRELRLMFEDKERSHYFPCSTPVFAEILDSVPKLEDLYLINVSISPNVTGKVIPPRSIRRLEVFTSFTTFRPANDPRQLLCLFNEIGTLRIENSHMTWPCFSHSTCSYDLPHALKIETLILIADQAGDAGGLALQTLVSALAEPVRSLELCLEMTEDGFLALEELWSKLGPQLDTVAHSLFRKGLGKDSPTALQLARGFALSRCTQVKTAVLTFDATVQGQWQALLEILCQLEQAPSLRQVVVRPYVDYSIWTELAGVQEVLDPHLVQEVGTKLLELVQVKQVDLDMTLTGRGFQESFVTFDMEKRFSLEDIVSNFFPLLAEVVL